MNNTEDNIDSLLKNITENILFEVGKGGGLDQIKNLIEKQIININNLLPKIVMKTKNVNELNNIYNYRRRLKYILKSINIGKTDVNDIEKFLTKEIVINNFTYKTSNKRNNEFEMNRTFQL